MARPKEATCSMCGRKAHPDGIRHTQTKPRPDRYQARFSDPHGRRQSSSFLTVQDAKAWLAQQHTLVSSGKWDQSAAHLVISFEAYAAEWLKHREVKGRPIAGRTREGYEDLLNRFILTTFGTRPVHAITREDVIAWHQKTANDTPTYRARAYSLLRTILASAIDEGHIEGLNPARIKGAGSVERQHKVEPATLKQLDEITWAMPERYRLIVQLAAFCALRFGELTELRRKDVDAQEGILRVRRAVVLVDGEFVVKTPKSAAGVRDVRIPESLLVLVDEHLRKHTAPGAEVLLFSARNSPDEHLRQSSLARVYYRAREKAGRPDLRFHDLRHTGAVLAAQTGATLAELMGRLGHSTASAAMRYQHVAQGRDAVIASRLSALLDAHSAARSDTD